MKVKMNPYRRYDMESGAQGSNRRESPPAERWRLANPLLARPDLAFAGGGHEAYGGEDGQPGLTRNALRQEEIIGEIEVILMSTGDQP